MPRNPYIYTDLLYALTGSNLSSAPVAAFTPPAGERWVLRDVEFAMAASATNQIHITWGEGLTFDETSVLPMVALFPGGVTVGPAWIQWRGRQVFDPGITCYFQDESIGGLSSVSMMGYKLTLP